MKKKLKNNASVDDQFFHSKLQYFFFILRTEKTRKTYLL